MSGPALDDLGYAVPLATPPRRVVSLVPSLTETIAVSAPGRLVAATDWCVHPADLDVERVRGTKNPDVDRIIALPPELVVANEEENRRADVEALRAGGIPVWVTDIRTADGALRSIARLLDLLDAPHRSWLEDARTVWGGPPAYPAVRVTAAVAIWRRPWMWLGRDTYAGDLLRRLGVANVLAGHAERYPRIEPAGLPPHELVVLPDEPYPFTATDGPEAFRGRRVTLVDGAALTWYGPRMVGARALLATALEQAVLR